MPLLWTAVSYGLMGVVNPLLQERVDWPWFIVSQFVFGVVAAIVVVRSEQILVPPAGAETPEAAKSCRAQNDQHAIADGACVGGRCYCWLLTRRWMRLPGRS